MLTIIVGVDTPFIQPKDESEHARRVAVKEAMILAVEAADPGDVIIQDDVELTGDPFDTPLTPGTVTMLNPQVSARHWCPKAFRFATEEDKQAILEAWRHSRHRTCLAWQDIPKTYVDCSAGRD